MVNSQSTTAELASVSQWRRRKSKGQSGHEYHTNGSPASQFRGTVFLRRMLQAEEQGLLSPNSGDVIYEGTVGSTGISLATICRARGYLAHMYAVTHNKLALNHAQLQ